MLFSILLLSIRDRIITFEKLIYVPVFAILVGSQEIIGNFWSVDHEHIWVIANLTFALPEYSEILSLTKESSQARDVSEEWIFYE